MKAMKIRITDKEHSRQVQEALFAAGYGWNSHRKDILHTDAKFLFACCFGGNEITYEWDDEKYLLNHKATEHFLHNGQFITELPPEQPAKPLENIFIKLGGGTTKEVARKALEDAGYHMQRENESVFNAALATFVTGNSDGLIGYGTHFYWPTYRYQERCVWQGMLVGKAYFTTPKTEQKVAVTDEQTIATQKAVADKILDKLFPIDPFAICAGGAPRDWHFGKPAADIDIFFHTSVDQITIVEEMLRRVGINLSGARHAENLPEWYKLNSHLKCVYETVVDGVNVQLMLMNDITHRSVIPQFPFSICKVWYKNGEIRRENIFDHCERHKVVVKTSEIYSDEHRYVQKIKAKFPEYQFFDSWQEAYKHVFERAYK